VIGFSCLGGKFQHLVLRTNANVFASFVRVTSAVVSCHGLGRMAIFSFFATYDDLRDILSVEHSTDEECADSTKNPEPCKPRFLMFGNSRIVPL